MTSTATTATQAPAERIKAGEGRQVVNQYDAAGHYLRQVSYHGTEAQARAYALLLTLHDTDPRRPAALAALRGK